MLSPDNYTIFSINDFLHVPLSNDNFAISVKTHNLATNMLYLRLCLREFKFGVVFLQLVANRSSEYQAYM